MLARMVVNAIDFIIQHFFYMDMVNTSTVTFNYS